MAEDLNQRGNSFYKEANFESAEEFYRKASQRCTDEPKYLSNLSAALYEQGKYAMCIQAIDGAWDKIVAKSVMDQETDALSENQGLCIKLATRYFKARLQAYAGSGNLLRDSPGKKDRGESRDRKDIEDYAAGMVAVFSDNVKLKEMIMWWDQWKSTHEGPIPKTPMQRQQVISQAQARFRGRRIYKWSSDPTLEHYNFGHDDIHSLLDGVQGMDNMYPIKLHSIDVEEREEALTFLFGGSGDARHAFGTLLDAHHQLTLEDMRPLPRVHMTLVDIHPATVARTLIIFGLLHRIPLADPNERLKLETTLFYLYTSLAIPDYCNAILMNIAEDLVISDLKSQYFPQWCIVNPQSSASIIDVLKYWSEPLKKSTQIILQNHRNLPSKISIFNGGQFATVSDENYMEPMTEEVIYEYLSVLLPPRALLDYHPCLTELVGSYDAPNIPKLASANLISSAMGEVYRGWRPNPTLFDKQSTEHPMFGNGDGYPLITMNPQQTLMTLLKANQRFAGDGQVPLPFGKIALSVVSTFFTNVMNAIESFGQSLTIEVVVGDVISGLPKLIAGDLGKRPVHFPEKFSRIWLSNVPDYTNGILNVAVHILPYHLVTKNNEIRPMTLANCLLNTPAFRSKNDYCYNYTLLPEQDLQKFLGCLFDVSNPNGMLFNAKLIMTPQALPMPLTHLATKESLYRWLSHVLLCTLCCGVPLLPPQRVDLPNNLDAYFRLLAHLHTVGFPSHWLGDFVEMLLYNRLVTCMKPYPEGRLPIPPSAGRDITRSPRQVHLDAWQAELEVIVGTIKDALPFHIMVPKTYPSLDEIGLYRTQVQAIDLFHHPSSRFFGPLCSPTVMVNALLFYRPQAGLSPETLCNQVVISYMIEGHPNVPKHSAQIILGAEYMDLSKGEIRWNMSKSRYQSMKEEKWEVVVYRTDLGILATEPVGADNWCEQLFDRSS